MTPLANLLDSGVSRRRVFSAIARATLGVTAAEAVFTGRADARGPTSTANIITLFLAGGLSHIDTFDPKPGREEQGPTGVIGTNVPEIGRAHV